MASQEGDELSEVGSLNSKQQSGEATEEAGFKRFRAKVKGLEAFLKEVEEVSLIGAHEFLEKENEGEILSPAGFMAGGVGALDGAASEGGVLKLIGGPSLGSVGRHFLHI